MYFKNMPHYSEQPNNLSRLTTIDNNISTVKTGPGTYKNFYRDKNGKLKEEKIVYHDEKAIENAEKVDKDIKDARKKIENFNLYQNKLNTALKKKEDAEDALYDAEERAKKTEQELANKAAALDDAKNQLSQAQFENEEAQAERAAAYDELNSMDPNSPEYDNAVARCDAADALCEQTENNVTNAESDVNDAQIDHDAAEGANEEAQAEREAAFDQCEMANEAYDDTFDPSMVEPDYSDEDVEMAKNQAENTRRSSSRYGLGQAAIEGGTRKNPGDDILNRAAGRKVEIKPNELFDLRNLPNGINFRGIGKAQNAISAENYTLSPSRSFYLSDYKFADSLTITEDLVTNPKVQPIILNEFQPYDMLSPADVLDGIGNLLIKTFNMAGGTALGTPVVKAGSYFISKMLIDQYATKTAKIYGNGGTRERAYFTTDPVQIVQNMFNGGRWLNTYELPYFGGDYLKANYSNNWTLGDSSGFLGALAGSEKEVGAKMLGIDFPSNPKFKAKMDQSRDPIQLEFYLINSDNTWLKRNFQFLNAIYAGANWLHMKFCFIRPPNVYHVLCPGRFQIYWAAIDVTVTFEGKLRRNETVSNELKQYSKAITSDMLWPDAWKMHINIRDLTPNNFNLYAEYYKNGFNPREVADLENIFGVTDMLDNAKKYFTELQQDMQPAIDAAKKLAEQGVAKGKELLDALQGNSPKEGQQDSTTSVGNGKTTGAEHTTMSEIFQGEANAEQDRVADIQRQRDMMYAKQASKLGVSSQEFDKMVEEEMKKGKYQEMVDREYAANKTWYGGMTGQNETVLQQARDSARASAQFEVRRRLQQQQAMPGGKK